MQTEPAATSAFPDFLIMRGDAEPESENNESPDEGHVEEVAAEQHVSHGDEVPPSEQQMA